mgnify:CR=1 FL=1
MSDELKPCPFCGAKPASAPNVAVCQTKGCYFYGARVNSGVWNRRAIPSPESVTPVPEEKEGETMS